MRTPLNLRRGFLCCAIGETDKQDVSLYWGKQQVPYSTLFVHQMHNMRWKIPFTHAIIA